VYKLFQKPEETTFQSELKEVLLAVDIDSESNRKLNNFNPQGSYKTTEVEEFQFDPNTATMQDFLRLGLSERVARSIENYRSKGGKFYIKEDFSKIYTLREEDFKRLEPWILIPERNKKSDLATRFEKETVPASGYKAQKETYSGKTNNRSLKESIEIDINKATEEEWQKLKGIGASYARRIVGFRDKLGGFHAVKQVGETYGLPDSTFQSIFPNLKVSSILRKIPVNKATESELNAHPYISSMQAKALSNYIKMNGPLKGMADFRKVAVFKEEDWQRLEPYLNFE
jgi:competence ComEA-like helix-hairpin-helix protein